MEGGKKSGSSFTSDLFGSKDSNVAASSSGILGSIFAPPTKAVGSDLFNKPGKEKKQDSGSQSCNSKTAVSESNAVNDQGNFLRSESKDMRSSYPVENVHPCHYSSSIYYGGQDVYARPQTAQSTVFTTFNKDGGEDDSDGASRGNWWQGRYYLRASAAA
ncbi:hypothetical protein F511_11433 [Dorcoceras hygrometricum]|uniref:Uncharacterized protein n=1 Tax=Dorcoceras hygrometricum TaxID=472368 RepID=A0A2Z7CZP0_9LAMI|nr:hypothetical protein F511_11433 [Dorcoceras hygrometricum]